MGPKVDTETEYSMEHIFQTECNNFDWLGLRTFTIPDPLIPETSATYMAYTWGPKIANLHIKYGSNEFKTLQLVHEMCLETLGMTPHGLVAPKLQYWDKQRASSAFSLSQKACKG